MIKKKKIFVSNIKNGSLYRINNKYYFKINNKYSLDIKNNCLIRCKSGLLVDAIFKYKCKIKESGHIQYNSLIIGDLYSYTAEYHMCWKVVKADRSPTCLFFDIINSNIDLKIIVDSKIESHPSVWVKVYNMDILI